MATLKGIDVSKWQGVIDWNKVRSDGIQFAILRAGYGKTADGKLKTYAYDSKKAGVPIRGVYWFCYALNEEQARQEAITCIKSIENAGLGKDVQIFFDFEYDTVESAAKKGVYLGKAQCIAFTIAFCNEVIKHGYKAGYYTNGDFYKRFYDDTVKGKYDLWLADYTGKPDYPCVFQQYTSKGKVNGISGYVDLNYWFPKEEVSLLNPYKEPILTVKRGTKGESAKWVQWELVQAGANIAIDGSFGILSESALIYYQKLHNLQVDGRCGKQTRTCMKND